jgi:hypothetical protein
MTCPTPYGKKQVTPLIVYSSPTGYSQRQWRWEKATDPPPARLACASVGGRVAPASGLVNRSSSPESVRYVSVTSVVQRRLLTNDDRG